MEAGDTVDTAVDECIKNDILMRILLIKKKIYIMSAT